ncbi:MAG: DegT/DnrJ/EryC1/StrS family aminotransferase [Verrucomicrobiales bacterium]|nr:DegT/DnrJ/EryC1/StrS family aminotransferase [Verrucomicrobiales bacterium]
MIRLAIPSIEADDLEAVRETLASGHLVQGPRVAAFERAVAAQAGVPHAVAVSNCTCALQLALLALDVRPGDLCVVTAYSWVSTANVIELCGAEPVFVDVDPTTFNLDLNHLECVLDRLMANRDTARRVKAVLPVHAFGQMVDMARLNALCARWELPVVEDAACALGAAVHGRQAGSWGTLGCFSFHPRKAVTTGEGGVVTTHDAALADRVRALRNHGLDPNAAAPDFIMPGYNNRMTEFQAALGLAQMTKLQRIIAARRAAAARYDALLKGGRISAPAVAAGAEHVYQSYVTQIPSEAVSSRADLIRRCREAGVETQIGTIHMPLTTFYRSRYGHQPGDFPGTDEAAARALTLPLHEAITATQQESVIELLNRLLT